LSSEERGPGGEVRFTWDLHTNGLKPRLTPGHTIEFCDEHGVPRLRINAPEGKDAAGKFLRAGEQLKLSLDGERLTLACDLSRAKFPVVIDPTFSSPPANNATTIPFSDGMILYAGGQLGGGGASSACAIFNPGTGLYTTAASLNKARWEHKGVLLQNGKVLVVSGRSITEGAIGESEVYDRGLDSWTTVGSINQYRPGSWMQITLLNSGKVLLTGGGGEGPTGIYPAKKCELLDPNSGQWQYTGSLVQGRKQHQAKLLSNGSVVVFGGFTDDGGGGVISATLREVYDPATELWHTASAPTANSLSIIVQEDQPTSGTLSGSTTEGTQLQYTISEPPLKGTVAITNSATGEFTYTPNQNQTGSDTFIFRLNDEISEALGTVSVEINPINDSPVSDSQTITTSHLNSKLLTLTGSDLESDPLTFVVSQPQHGILTGTPPQLTYTPAANFVSQDSFTFKVNDGTLDSNVSTVTIDITNTIPVAVAQSVSTHWGTPTNITLAGSDADNNALTFNIVQQPVSGTLSGTAPFFTFTPTGTFTGSDSFTFNVNDGAAESGPVKVSITLTNTAPSATSGAAPTSATPSQFITFTSTGTDPDGDALTYLWDFGDGATSTDQNATHAYAEVGSYTATVTVSDAAGGTASASVTIQVSKAPTGRVTTGDVVAFGGLPFTFDASSSTDPENAIVSYVWNFGDGTPNGSGQVISKIYEQPGTYTVTLTITDAAGVSTTVSCVIEVLPGDQAGLFNGYVDYKVGWNRLLENKDTLTLNASVNVGDDVVGKDTTLAVEIAGRRFTGKLDSKLKDSVNADAKWTVKASVRKQPAGTVIVSLKVKNASLGAGFNQMGVLGNNDPSDVIEKDIPVRLEIGTRSFEVLVPSEFKFNARGQKAKGIGNS
ncbi:MAG TPA: Ig-like domain-containing protein, partial [Planctomycetota bacterium]|nr:Ig-like domain-containing protein [Planctomycetota bacterium]